MIKRLQRGLAGKNFKDTAFYYLTGTGLLLPCGLVCMYWFSDWIAALIIFVLSLLYQSLVRYGRLFYLFCLARWKTFSSIKDLKRIRKIVYMSDEAFEQASAKIQAHHAPLFMALNDYLFLPYPYVHLKDDLGRVVRALKSFCYAPDDDGKTCAPLGGFAYFWGFPTLDSVTHVPINHPDLFVRGLLVPIDQCEQLLSASASDVFSAAGINMGRLSKRSSTQDDSSEETLRLPNLQPGRNSDDGV